MLKLVLLQVKAILLKHLESAPKEILGDFPRLSREGAMLMINNTARSLAQGQDTVNQKIPSLFELNLPAPSDKNDEKEERGNLESTQKSFLFKNHFAFSYKLTRELTLSERTLSN